MKTLDLYLALERLMLELDADSNAMADRIRDLMDPLWLRLSPEELARLDARGQIEPADLFPVQLPIPPPPALPAPTVRDQRFDHASWQAPHDWRREAA